MKFNPSGIIPPIVTPLDAKGQVCEGVLSELVNYLIDGGVHGIFAMGTTGEFYGFSPEEKREIFRITVKAVHGRVPVYAGTGGITTRECIDLTRIAEETGVDAVSVLTPMFIQPSQEELIRHFEAVAASIHLPIILYNNLPKTGVTVYPETVERLADVDNIVGIKDSSGDFTLTAEYIRRTRGKHFHVLSGRDTLIYACLCYGGSGAIAACANVAPRICSDIYDKYTGGDLKGSLEAQFTIAPLRIALSLGTVSVVIKEALQLIGIDTGSSLSPLGPMCPEGRQRLAVILRQMGILKCQEA